MASNNEISTLAKSAQDLANKVKELQNLAVQFLASNTAQNIDWANLAATNPGAIKPDGSDGAGDLISQDFNPSEMSNVIGALATTVDFLDTQMVNFELLAKPIV